MTDDVDRGVMGRLNLDRARDAIRPCGTCDGGLPAACRCADVRPILGALIVELAPHPAVWPAVARILDGHDLRAVAADLIGAVEVARDGCGHIDADCGCPPAAPAADPARLEVAYEWATGMLRAHTAPPVAPAAAVLVDVDGAADTVAAYVTALETQRDVARAETARARAALAAMHSELIDSRAELGRLRAARDRGSAVLRMALLRSRAALDDALNHTGRAQAGGRR